MLVIILLSPYVICNTLLVILDNKTLYTSIYTILSIYQNKYPIPYPCIFFNFSWLWAWWELMWLFMIPLAIHTPQALLQQSLPDISARDGYWLILPLSYQVWHYFNTCVLHEWPKHLPRSSYHLISYQK